jgi:hypothetical protein
MMELINKIWGNMIKQYRNLHSHSYTFPKFIRYKNPNANAWNTTFYSYHEISTTTTASQTALYTLKKILKLPTCTVFASLQGHLHATEDFCKTTKHMAYQNLLISFIWPT